MLTISDQSEGALLGALQEQLKYIEDERTRERDYLMDFYEGINIDHYVSEFFGAETLRQAVTPQTCFDQALIKLERIIQLSLRLACEENTQGPHRSTIYRLLLY